MSTLRSAKKGSSTDGMTKKMKQVIGYSSGSEWYNPLTVVPHTMLQQKLPSKHLRSIDFWLKVMGMGFDDMNTVIDVTILKNRGGSVSSYRSKVRLFYGLLVDALLLLNIVRMFAMMFVKDQQTRANYGDLSFLWDERPHFITIPIMYAHVCALLINLAFQFLQGPDVCKKWIVPFGIFANTVTPHDVRIKSIHHVRRLVQVTDWTMIITAVFAHAWTAAAGYLFIGSAMRYNSLSSLFPLYWSICQTVTVYYSMGIISWSLGYFVILCFHQSCRFKRLSAIIYGLMDRHDVIPAGKRHEFMTEVIVEHDQTAYDTHYANRVWKYIIALMFALYGPLGYWLIYAGSFYKTTIMFKVILWIVLAQITANSLILMTAGELVACEAHKGYQWLNALTLETFPIQVKLKMSELVERMAGPTVGFYCHDSFVLARESVWEMAMVLGTTFFLMADFVLSYT